jgi:glycosyltransferase involved in cell wall biosynthesis/predicted O-methyltransferase YrrM
MGAMDHIFSISTHMTRAERLLLLELAQALPDKPVVVEIGSYLGASTCFWAEGVRAKDGIVYAVDPWTNLGMSEGEQDTYAMFLENTSPYRETIQPLRGFSAEIAPQFHQAIDLLFVDGDHSYEGARTDLENWLPKVKEGSWVVCHDYSWAEGVRRAIREFLAPLQITGGWQLDGTYWTQISHQRHSAINVTIAMPTYQRREYALAALESVLAQEVAFSFEVLVLDNEGDRALETAITERAAKVSVPLRYIHVTELGLHNGRNLGAIAARGNFVVYIDDDVLVPPGWLAALCAPFADPAIGGVAGQVQPQWETLPPDWLAMLDPSYFSALDLGPGDRDLQWPETPYGCNMAYRRELVLSLGGFAPDGVGGHWIEWQRGDGETGFAHKVYNEGYRLAYRPTAWLSHCIPSQRQTVTFARRRAIKGAISGAYFIARQVKLSRPHLLWQALKYSLKAGRDSLRWVLKVGRPLTQRLPAELQLLHNAIAGLYCLRAIVDPQLRHWIARSDYWPTQTVPPVPDLVTAPHDT